MKFKVLSLKVLLVFFSSCNFFSKKNIGNEQPVARVNDEYLYYSDIEPILKSAGNARDSATVAKSYVDDWIKRKLMLQKAQVYLPAEKLDIERQVSDYRESLILYTYEKELILQKLDTAVPVETLMNYFEGYKTNFVLNEGVVQMHYVKVARDAPKIDSLARWFGSDNEMNKARIEDYCHRYAADFSLNDSMWQAVSAVFKSMPVSSSQLEALNRYKTTTVVGDSLFNYVVKVKDSKAKGEIAPFDYVKDDIARIILNKRKMELVRSTYENIYLEAQRSNKFEIYE